MNWRNIPWKRIFSITTWSLLGLAFIVLWVIAAAQQQAVIAHTIQIKIDRAKNKLFIAPSDINEIIRQSGYDTLVGKPLGKLAFNKLEKAFEDNPWIDDAEIYTTKNGDLTIAVQQRCPLMRIINKNNVGFYIDKKGTVMLLSSKFTPRVLVVTGEITNSDFNSSDPSKSKRYDLVQLAEWISKDPFWNAQITQVEVHPNQEVSLYTLIGDVEVDFGKADDFENKFRKLKLFYLDGLNLAGWNKYSRIIIKYDRQIVGVKK